LGQLVGPETLARNYHVCKIPQECRSHSSSPSCCGHS